MLTSASNFTSPSVSAKLIVLNCFLRVDQRVQQCLNFHFALFVTRCLGLDLWILCHLAPRPVSRPSYYLVSATVFQLPLAQCFANYISRESISASVITSANVYFSVSGSTSRWRVSKSIKEYLCLEIAYFVAQRLCHDLCFRQSACRRVFLPFYR